MDRSSRPHVVENHDAALHVWCRLGVRGRTLVHVDTHHDMWNIDERADRVDIRNYVCQALREGIGRDVVWVVPDASWAPGRRPVLRRHLRRLMYEYGARAPIERGDRRLSTFLGDTPVLVCALDTLPACSEPVLLDLDAGPDGPLR
jgi:hypothetical protein